MTELNGIPVSPDGEPLPEGKPQPSLQKTKILGVGFIVGSVVMAYFFILQPLREAQRTGQLEYYMKGVLLPPALLYMGIALLVSDLRDGQFRTVRANGRPGLTSKGRWFMAGLIAVLALTLITWHFYLRSIGFSGAF